MSFRKTIIVFGFDYVGVSMAFGNWAALAKEPYKIGVAVPITGAASILGEPKRNTAIMIADMVQQGPAASTGHPLKLIIYDTESNATKAPFWPSRK